jgi:predicted RNA-binding protein YlqC (UPF0109 family)
MASESRKITDDDVTDIATLVAVAVRAIVTNPDAVEISADRSSHRLVVLFSADPADSGRVIGSKGVIIQSLRDVVHAAARVRCINVDIVFKNDKNAHQNRQDQVRVAD